jgi:acid phosphatase (class A)
MTTKNLVANIFVLFASGNLCGQTPAINPVAKEVLTKTSASHPSYYIDPSSLHLDLILSPPPARDSAIPAAELKELHRIEAARTAEQVTQAKADDQEEDIFLFKSVLGPGFTAEALPITASLSTHIRKDEGADSFSAIRTGSHRSA